MVRVTEWRVLLQIIGFISTLVTASPNYSQYSAIADLRNLQFTVAHALGFSVFTSRLLATDLNTDTITSFHYESFLSSATLYSSVLICTRSSQFTLHSRPCSLNCWTHSWTLYSYFQFALPAYDWLSLSLWTYGSQLSLYSRSTDRTENSLLLKFVYQPFHSNGHGADHIENTLLRCQKYCVT
jgi:hypothetical protein